jgi:hypothetical protein
MSEFTAANLFAPPGGWRVRILDLSGGAEDGISEEIRGFPTLMQANEFARRYVRDSVELCRAPGLDAAEIIEAWRAFGEDAEVLDAGEGGWQSEGELYAFATNPAPDPERDWRALDPRADEDAIADDDAAAEPGAADDGDDDAFDDDDSDDDDGEDAAG